MKKVIIFTSFGVADARARAACLDATAFEIARAFPNYTVLQAYTSETVRAQMSKQGLRAPSLIECFDELKANGCEEVYIQPSHLTPGEEYNKKIVAVAESYKDSFQRLTVGEPLFFQDYDYDDVLAAIAESLARNNGEEIVLMGHGSPHQHNPVYEKLQKRAEQLHFPMTVGVVEESDTPDLSMVIKRLKAKGAKKIMLAPLLMVGGVHVMKDMAGDGDNSWKNRLMAEGFEVRVEPKALGTYPALRAIFIKKTGRLTGYIRT